MATITMKPINARVIHFHIIGTTSMIHHNWSQKSIAQMRDKHAGKKTVSREIRNPKEEFQNACYLTENNEYGFPLMAFKTALITAAHRDIGIEKTLVRKAIFVKSDDSGLITKMKCNKPIMREDTVRVGQGKTDLRYRPEYKKWSAEIFMEIDGDLLTAQDVINLTNRAGFGVGIGEWRPEKGGEMGRFKVDETKKVEIL